MENNKKKNKNLIKWLSLGLCGLVICFMSFSVFSDFTNVNANTNDNRIPMSFYSNGYVTFNALNSIDNSSKILSSSLDYLSYDMNRDNSKNTIYNMIEHFNSETNEYEFYVADRWFQNILIDGTNYVAYATTFNNVNNVTFTLNNIVLPIVNDDFEISIKNVLDRVYIYTNYAITELLFDLSYIDNSLNEYNYSGGTLINNSVNSFRLGTTLFNINNELFLNRPFITDLLVDSAVETEFMILDKLEFTLNFKDISNSYIYNNFYVVQRVYNVPNRDYKYNISNYNAIINSYNNDINLIYFENGANDSSSYVNPFSMIIDTVNEFLNLEIFPMFKVYYLFVIGFGVTILAFFVKWALGG